MLDRNQRSLSRAGNREIQADQMNRQLYCLRFSPPLTQFFLECGGLVRTDKKPALCKSYQKLISEVWHKKR